MRAHPLSASRCANIETRLHSHTEEPYTVRCVLLDGHDPHPCESGSRPFDATAVLPEVVACGMVWQDAQRGHVCAEEWGHDGMRHRCWCDATATEHSAHRTPGRLAA